MAYRMASFPMTLSELQGHRPTANILNAVFLYICTSVDRSSTVRASRGYSEMVELFVSVLATC